MRNDQFLFIVGLLCLYLPDASIYNAQDNIRAGKKDYVSSAVLGVAVEITGLILIIKSALALWA